MKNQINESSLSRVWSHLNDENKVVVIFTLCRNEQTESENLRLNKEAARVIRAEGFGYFWVEGGFVENQGKENEARVEEDSIFAIADIKDGKRLIDVVQVLAFEPTGYFEPQDSIAIKEVKADGTADIYLLNNQGHRDETFDNANIGGFGEFYSRLRNDKVSNTFVFESTRLEPSYFGRLSNARKNAKK